MGYELRDEVLVKARIVEVGACTYGLNTPEGIFFTVKKDNVFPIPIITGEEAWDIAKKLFADYSNIELDEIFGKGWSYPKIMEMTPQQAKEKIEAWKVVKEIKIGDEVVPKHSPNSDDYKFFVTHINKKDDVIDGFSGFSGKVFSARDIAIYQKTGRHIDIAGIMKQIEGVER